MVKASINDRIIYNLVLIVREQTLDIEELKMGKRSPFVMIRGIFVAPVAQPTQKP